MTPGEVMAVLVAIVAAGLMAIGIGAVLSRRQRTEGMRAMALRESETEPDSQGLRMHKMSDDDSAHVRWASSLSRENPALNPRLGRERRMVIKSNTRCANVAPDATRLVLAPRALPALPGARQTRAAVAALGGIMDAISDVNELDAISVRFRAGMAGLFGSLPAWAVA